MSLPLEILENGNRSATLHSVVVSPAVQKLAWFTEADALLQFVASHPNVTSSFVERSWLQATEIQDRAVNAALEIQAFDERNEVFRSLLGFLTSLRFKLKAAIYERCTLEHNEGMSEISLEQARMFMIYYTLHSADGLIRDTADRLLR